MEESSIEKEENRGRIPESTELHQLAFSFVDCHVFFGSSVSSLRRMFWIWLRSLNVFCKGALRRRSSANIVSLLGK